MELHYITDLIVQLLKLFLRDTYVCRTAKNTLLYEAGDEFHFADLPLCPGERLGIPEVQFTQDRYGPVLAIGWWAKCSVS